MALGCRPTDQPMKERSMSELTWEIEGTQEQEFQIASGETQVGVWTVRGEQAGRLLVEQRGIDVEVRVFLGDGEAPIRIVDGMNGDWGTERVLVAPEEDTRYRIEIKALSTQPPTAPYLLKSESHPAREQDLAAVTGDEEFDAAERYRHEKASLEPALFPYRAALDHFTQAGDAQGRWDCLQRLGWAHERLGHPTEAFDAYQQLLDASQALGNRKEEGNTLNRLGRLALSQSKPEESEEFFERALQVAIEEGDDVLRARTLHNQASASVLREDLATALERFSEVRRMWQKLENPAEEANTLYNLSRALQGLGRYPDTVDALEEALALRRGLDDTQGVATVLLQLGNVRRLMGDFQESEAHFEDALEESSKISNNELRLLLSNNLGLVRAESGQRSEAAAAFEEVLEEAHGLNQRPYEAMAALNFAALRREEGDITASFELLERARALFSSLDDRRHLAACSLLEGLALRDRGDGPAALTKLERAVAEVEALRLGYSGWALRMAFFETRQSYYDELADLQIDLHRSTGNAYYLEQALFTSERRRARSLLDAVAEGPLKFRGDASLLEREQRLSGELAEVDREAKLGALAAGADLVRRQRRLLLELETVRGEIRRTSPQYAEITRHEPLAAEAIRQQVLDEDTRLLVYSLGQTRSFLFTLGRDEPLEVFQLAGRQHIRRAVEAARQAFTSLNQERWPRHRRSLQELSDLLLGPVASTLDGRRLAIVADGILQTLPFSGLLEPSGRPTDAGRPFWMLEDREVVHLPSASSLAALRRETRARQPARYELAVFADPVFSASDERLEERFRQAAIAAEGLKKDSTRAYLTATSRGGKLYRLADTERELRAIQKLANPDRSRFFQGFAANRQAFENPEIEDFRILHFATHGLLDAAHPDLSGLALSLLDEEGHPIDGFIRTHEIYSRSLRADLVVLSACETGLGKEVRGEGLVGLPRGFLYAGVPRVVVSLWNVNDASTAELMTDFYTHLADGEPPSAALRQAQLKMMRSKERGAPYYWAPFIFLGDWQGTEVSGGGFGQEDPGTVILTDPGKGSSYGTEGAVGFTHREPETSIPPDDFANGVDETGAFLSPEIRGDQGLTLSDREQRRLQNWSENRDPLRLPEFGAEPENLDEAGWGVIFGPEVTNAVKANLRPLLEHRQGQAGGLYQEIQLGTDPDPLAFLEDRGVLFRRAIPKKLPYYLLIVGDPAGIPFEFQYRVDVQHAVGRVHLPNPEDYATYAQSVLAAEKASGEGREAILWGTRIRDDPRSDWMMRGLLEPVLRDLKDWRGARGLYDVSKARDGRKATLLQQLQTPPAFLFTASHGTVFSTDPEERRERQGSLVCEDWNPGLGGPGEEVCVGADDIPKGTDLKGLIACHFACYSAGCSRYDPFERPMVGRGRQLHDHAFVSRLSQRLLSCGAQAVLGHVDRAWETTFSFSNPTQGNDNQIFCSMLRQLFSGHRLGHATESVNSSYADCASELHRHLEARPLPGTTADRRLQRIRKATLDARNYVVIGDPAVRLVGAVERRARDRRREAQRRRES